MGNAIPGQQTMVPIGPLVKESLGHLPAMMRLMSGWIVALALLSAAPALATIGTEDYLLRSFVILGAGLLQMIGLFLFQLLIIFVAGALWRGEQVRVRDAFDRITMGLLGRYTIAVLRVSIVGSLGLCLFVIPGLVYFLNRVLAWVILFLEDAPVGVALTRSRELMCSAPWYSPTGPKAAWLVIFLGLFFLGLPLSFVVGFTSRVAEDGSLVAGVGAVLGGVGMSIIFALSALLLVGLYLRLTAAIAPHSPMGGPA